MKVIIFRMHRGVEASIQLNDWLKEKSNIINIMSSSMMLDKNVNEVILILYKETINPYLIKK